MILDGLGRWEVIPPLITSAASLALAVWLHVLDPRSRVHQTLAVYLVLRSIGTLTTMFWDFSAEPSTSLAGGIVGALALILVTPVLLSFALLYPVAVGSPTQRRFANGIAWSVTGLVVAAVLVRPEWSGLPSTPLTEWYLFPFVQLGLVATGFMALWLSGHVRDMTGSARHSLWLVTLGFTLYPLYRGARSLDDLWSNYPGAGPAGFDWILFAEALQALAMLAALVAAVRLARHRRLLTGREPWGLWALFAAAMLVGLATAQGWIERSVTFPLVELALPVLVTYGILRHELFGLDPKVRIAVRGSTIAAAFIAVFFIVSETAAAFFESTTNSTLVGIAAAGLLLFALAPLHRVAERVSKAAVPDEGHLSDGQLGERTELFRDAVRLALRDGEITRDEERDLLRMAGRLGLTNEQAFELIDEVET